MGNPVITCEVNTPTESTTYTLSLGDDDTLGIAMHCNSTEWLCYLDQDALAILAAFLKYPAVAERVPEAKLRPFQLWSAETRTHREPLRLFADLYPKREK